MAKTNAKWGLELAPPWESGPIGELWTQSIGFLHDVMAEFALQASKGGLMRSNTFHVSGLPLIGTERQMPRYPSESDAEYLLRLRDAWTAWGKSGNFNAIVDQLAVIGLTAEIWEQGQKGPAPARGSSVIWNWDDDAANWSRFFVVITGHPWVSDGDWGDPGTWGDGGTWGSTATPEEVQTAQAIATHWKDAEAVYPHIIIVLDSGTWAGVKPVTTGDRYDVPANRSDSAIYLDGYGKRAY